MNIKEDNIIFSKSKDFANRIIKLYNYLSEKNVKVLNTQILKSGTSIGANIAESVYAITKNDFINKMHIAIKEASETAYWLQLLNMNNYINDIEYKSINDQCEELIKMLTSIIISAKKK